MNRQQYLKICTEEYIKTVCEGCYNVINRNIELDKREKSETRKHLEKSRFAMRKINNPKVSLKTKRGLFVKEPQLGEVIFGFLAILSFCTQSWLYIYEYTYPGNIPAPGARLATQNAIVIQ